MGARRDHYRLATDRSRPACLVTRGRPPPESGAQHEKRLAVLEDECPVGKLVERGFVMELGARVCGQPLAVELRVDQVRRDLVRVDLAPDRAEAVVVGAATQCAGAMSRGEGGRLVEEEELGEATRLEQWASLPAAELETTRDPALAVEPPADLTGIVV